MNKKTTIFKDSNKLSKHTVKKISITVEINIKIDNDKFDHFASYLNGLQYILYVLTIPEGPSFSIIPLSTDL